MKFRLIPCTLIVSSLLGCSTASMKPLPAQGPTPVQLLACPKPTSLIDPQFGSVALKLTELAFTYRECRRSIGIKDDE